MFLTLLQYIFVFISLIFLYIKFNKWYRRERIDEFHKKSVFVTGTDSGFGKLLVTELDRRGLKVYAGCYTEKGAEELRKTSSERVKTIIIDVTKRETLEAARDFIEKDLGPNEKLWGLVNNAGIVKGILFDFCQLKDYRNVMEVNFFGVISTCEIFLSLMKKSKGRIVNISSVLGRSCLGSEPDSCSKHALEAYGDGLRRSMKVFGVHSAIIQPGLFRTPISTPEFWKAEMDRTWNELSTDLKQAYGQKYKDIVTEKIVEFNRKRACQWNKPEHVIKAIIHGLSSKRPKARYMVGIDALLYINLYAFVPDYILDVGPRKLLQYDKVPVRNR